MFKVALRALGSAGFVIAGVSAQAQSLEPVIVQGTPTLAIYDFHFVTPPGAPPTAQPFLLSGMAFESGNLLPQPLLNAIQWTDPLQPPPNFAPPIFFYQLDPTQPLPIDQLMVGSQFGAVGVLDGLIDFAPLQPTFDLPPQPGVPLGPGEQVFLPLPPDPTLLNPLIFQDFQEVPDGLSPLILVGLGLPGQTVSPRGTMWFGQADPQFEPIDPNTPGGNGEFVYVPAPATPDPCIDDSLFTEELFAFLRDEEAANGVHITSETSVVNGVTVRDKIVSYTEASDGFTYVTVVEDFVTTAFYRYPTGSPDPKQFVILPADLDQDGDVDDADFGLAFAAFTGPNNGPSSNPAADLDGDGDVDDADFGIAFASFTGPGGVPIPEPGTLALLALGGIALIRRR